VPGRGKKTDYSVIGRGEGKSGAWKSKLSGRNPCLNRVKMRFKVGRSKRPSCQEGVSGANLSRKERRGVGEGETTKKKELRTKREEKVLGNDRATPRKNRKDYGGQSGPSSRSRGARRPSRN